MAQRPVFARKCDHGGIYPIRDRHRPRGPCSAKNQEQDVLLLSSGLSSRRAQHPGLSRMPGNAWGSPRHQQEGGRVHHRHRAGPRLSDCLSHQVRPQELLLPRPDEGLPDLPVRHAHRHRRLPGGGDGWGEVSHPHPPGPPGGGCGQATARPELRWREL